MDWLGWRRLPETEEFLRRLKEQFQPNLDWQQASSLESLKKLQGQQEVLDYIEEILSHE